MKYVWFVLIAAAVFCGSLAPAWADDIASPPWTRYGAGTTWEGWTFSSPSNPSYPDEGFYNPYGIPSASITDPVAWLPLGYNSHIGVWVLNPDSSINVTVPDSLTVGYKEVFTQVTWLPGTVPGGGPTPTVVVHDGDGVYGGTEEDFQVLANGWYHAAWLTLLPNNPPVEIVSVSGTAQVGEVFVDTECTATPPVPEPGMIVALAGLAGMGLCGLVWRRRRA
jgi:hypothetical protein